MAQQRPNVSDKACRVAVAGKKAQPSLRIKYIAARSVIHSVAVGCPARHLLKEHFEVLRYPRGRGGIAIQPQKSRVKRRDVVREKLLRVALGIDRDEENLQTPSVFAQLVLHCFQFGECRRAHIGAAGIAEKHDHHFASKIGERPHSAGVVGKTEILAVIRTRDVGTLEGGSRCIAADERSENKSVG